MVQRRISTTPNNISVLLLFALLALSTPAARADALRIASQPPSAPPTVHTDYELAELRQTMAAICQGTPQCDPQAPLDGNAAALAAVCGRIFADAVVMGQGM
jgi:hypothetical protein